MSCTVPIIRRAILRYALNCPNDKPAAAYVEKWRKQDPETVKDVEEYSNAVRGVKPEGSLELTILRDGKKQKVTIKF